MGEKMIKPNQIQITELKEAYQLKLNGKISQEQLEDICVNWAYDNALWELTPSPFPTKPHMLYQYEHMTIQERKLLTALDIENIKKVRTRFYDTKIGIERKNKDNLWWLKLMKENLEKRGFQEQADKIQELITLHTGERSPF